MLKFKIAMMCHIFICCMISHIYGLGPVVQSVVSLTSSLRVISLIVLVDSIYLIFFAKKMWVAFVLQKLLTFFQQKISLNESLTNDVVSFEQLGPGH